MPPLTPSRILAMAFLLVPAAPAARLGAVLVFELALGDLFEGDREVIPLTGDINHGRWVLAEAALAETVEVAVYLPSPLGGDDDRCVVGVGVVEQFVNAWFDHSARESRDMPSSAR